MTAPTSTAGVAERALRYAIIAVFVEGVRRRDPGTVVNAVPAFAATYLPDFLERRYGVEFRPWQRTYLDVSMLAHAAGMLGPYDDTRWWDTITHTLSATLLGGFVHAVARRRGYDARRIVVGAVVCVGVLWEGLEYVSHAIADRLGVEPVLVQYSARDTAGDLLSNLFGALLVVAFGDRLLGNLIDGGRSNAGSHSGSMTTPRDSSGRSRTRS